MIHTSNADLQETCNAGPSPVAQYLARRVVQTKLIHTVLRQTTTRTVGFLTRPRIRAESLEEWRREIESTLLIPPNHSANTGPTSELHHQDPLIEQVLEPPTVFDLPQIF